MASSERVDPSGEGERGAGPGPAARSAELRAKAAARLADLRSRSPLVDVLARAWEHDVEVGGGIVGAAVAFRLFLFMVIVSRRLVGPVGWLLGVPVVLAASWLVFEQAARLLPATL